MHDEVALLARESRSLVQRLRLWTPARWAALAPAPGKAQAPAAAQAPAHAPAGDGTRADLVHHLAQCLADDAAAVEGAPRRPLPRLDSDLALPDQLAVTADDLVRAGPPPALARAATAHLLAHRLDLLDERVPDGLAARLGGDEAAVLAAGRQKCEECRARP